MQVDGNWKAAANLQLLLGEAHPPATLEKKLSTRIGDPGNILVDARNTAGFRTSTYCSIQDAEFLSVRRRLVAYYRELLGRIPLWQKREDNDIIKQDSSVKEEPAYENEEQPHQEGGASNFRALGILTQVRDGIGEDQFIPWEFYVIDNIDDEECYAPAFRALKRDIPQGKFSLLFNGNGAGGDAEAASSAVAQATREGNDGGSAPDGQRLSLFTKMANPFTGVYPGMAVGIVGETFQRSARGVLTGILLKDVILPQRPLFSWRVDRPLSAPSHAATTSGERIAARVHFCSGPFPRRDIRSVLRTVCFQALHRGADLLIIGGPLVKPFEDFEKEIMPALGMTFTDLMSTFVDSVEELLDEYYSTRMLKPRMKVVFVSHRDDVTQVPVLPTTMYAMTDTNTILFRSNPCRIALNGVHMSVCNEDVVGDMRDAMVERWPTAEGSLRRVVETVVQSRLYTPITSLPAVHVDMKHLAQLRIDYMPPQNDLLQLQGSAAAANRPSGDAGKNWELAFNANAHAEDLKEEEAAKRVKLEETAPAQPTTTTTTTSVFGNLSCTSGAATENMPHIMFLPSTRPRFAVVTHSATDSMTSHDDASAATGVLAVNQEVWSKRSAPKFELRVMEVTIPDCNLVAHRGASSANGVACGVLHIFNSS